MTYYVFDKGNLEEDHLTVQIDYNGIDIPAKIYPRENDKFHISYDPIGSGSYTIRVFYDGQEIQGSPFSMEVVDAKDIQMSGEGLSSGEVGQRSAFQVNIGRNVSLSDLKISITSPKGLNVIPQLYDRGDSVIVEFEPVESGEHLIDLKYLNNSLSGSPFSCQVTDINQIIMANLSQLGSINRPVEFEIDALRAGQGRLEIVVNDGSVPCSMDCRDGFRFRGSFVPLEAIPHVIKMKFNGKEVPGSPWLVDIKNPASTAYVDNRYQQSVSVNHSAELEVRLNTIDSDVTAQVTAPNRRNFPANVVNMRNGIYMVDFVPREAGTHLVQVMVDGVGVAGNPFVFKAYNSQAISLTSPGIAYVGQPAEFSIDASRAGDGLLEVQINKGSDENVTRSISKGIFQTSFVPKSTRPHVIDVSFNKEPVPQTPMTVPVMDSRQNGFHQEFLTRQNTFKISQQMFQSNQHPDEELTLKVTAPNGEQVPAKLIRHPDGNFITEYTSKYIGQHRVDIWCGGVPIMSSPFFTECYDPQKIKVEGNKTGMVGERMQLEIIRNQAGKAELDLSIKTPRGHLIKYDMVKTSKGERVWYIPQQPGFYTIDVLFGELQVPGCPFKQEIFDSSIVSVEGEGLHEGFEDHEASFVVDPKGQKGDLKVQIEGPNSIAKCTIKEDVMSRYVVSYYPRESGIFTIILKWNGRELIGSPFKPQISALKKVRVVGGWSSLLDSNELMTLKQNERKTIEFNTSGCGKGQLTATLTTPGGPSSVDVRKKDNEVYVVSFVPKDEGEYRLKVFWKGYQIDQSPLIGLLKVERVTKITTASHESQKLKQSHELEKIVLTGVGLQHATTNQQAEFFIDGSKAGPGFPTVLLEGPGGEVRVHVIPCTPSLFKCTYVPNFPGFHSLHITWADSHVYGSPFKVNVLSSSIYGNINNHNQLYSSSYLSPHIRTIQTYHHSTGFNPMELSPKPASVFLQPVSGLANQNTWQKDGYIKGFVDGELSILIDASKTEPGELAVVCRGPTNFALTKIEELRDGVYKANIKAREAGNHEINTTFNKIHVNGSPLTYKVSYPSNPRKIECYGPGLNSGLFRTFNSRFEIDTSKAGQGILEIVVYGPRSKTERIPLSYTKNKKLTLCDYQVLEPGEYRIEVKYDGEHVPRSPFIVHVFEHSSEFKAFSKSRGVADSGY